MERSQRAISPPSDEKLFSSPPKSPRQQPPLVVSPLPLNDRETEAQEFASKFNTLFHSIFPPKPFSFSASDTASPSSSSGSTAGTGDVFTEHRLHHARLILEYQELCDHYDLSLARLRSLSEELELLLQENAYLRFVNSDLVKLLDFSSKPTLQSRFVDSRDTFSDFGSITTNSNRFDLQRRNDMDQVSLPKSISVRSTAYHKLNKVEASHGDQGSSSTRSPLASQAGQLVSESVSVRHRVYLSEGGRGNDGTKEEEENARKLDVYNQGMWKTELCNKWEETGACPYGNYCRFAHGINELRPVIRHPRYKTEVCRMVLAGDVCPYAHRCHFRHTLTEQERLLALGPR